MGRYPYLTRLRVFLEEVKPFYAPVSHRNLTRKLRQVHTILQYLKANGFAGTTNPRDIGLREVGAFLDYISGRVGPRSNPMAPGTQEVLLGSLSKFLEYEGNSIVAKARAKGLIRVKAHSSGPLPSPSESEVECVVSRLYDRAAEGDVRNLGILGLVILGAYSGLRPKEARLANIEDLNRENWTAVVRHPKGEGTWGKLRTSVIVPIGRDWLERFLTLRHEELVKRGLRDEPGVPFSPCFRADGTVTHWSSTYALQVKRKLENALGVSFDFQMQRRAFGQNSIDRNARLDSVSVAMGHKTTRTTELYYARRKERQAITDIEEAWSSAEPQSGLIEQ